MLTLLPPLNKLLRKDTMWKWEKELEVAFEKSKKIIQSSDVLVHYDSQKDLVLSSDVLPYGIGAVLSHLISDGHERPIALSQKQWCLPSPTIHN